MGKVLEYVLQSFSHRNVCKNMHLYMIITWVYFVPSYWNFKFDFTICWTIVKKLLVNLAWQKENYVLHAKGLLYVKCTHNSFHPHTRAPNICSLLHRDRCWWSLSGQLCAWAAQVGTVDGRGHDGQQTDAFCDAHGPCQAIRSTFKPVFRRFQLIGYVYKLLWVLDFEIWRFRGDRQTNRLL